MGATECPARFWGYHVSHGDQRLHPCKPYHPCRHPPAVAASQASMRHTCLQEGPLEGPGLGDPFRPLEWLVELTDLALRGQTGDGPLSLNWPALLPAPPWPGCSRVSPGTPRTSRSRGGKSGLRGSALAVSPGDGAWFLEGEASRGPHVSEAGFKSGREQMVSRSEFSSKRVLSEGSVKGSVL